jgi:hypothetical protein
MNRRVATGGIVLFGLGLARPAAAQFYINASTQRIDATIISGEEYATQFLPCRGARRISATVSCDVRASAYLDISDNLLDRESTVLGVSAVELLPKQAQLLILPAELVDVLGVRLRVVNRDRTFGTVRGTLSVLR